MKKQQKQAYSVTNRIHPKVSTMRRFADRADYDAAVRIEYHSRFPYRHLPSNPPLGSCYSFHNYWTDTELLFLHLLGGGPTIGFDIPYYYIGNMTLSDFNIYYDSQVDASSQVERPGNSPRGEKDKPGVYRAVYKITGLAGDYAGFITNPPYPAFIGSRTRSRLQWLLPAVLGLAAGLAAIPLIRALRVRPKD